MYWTFYNPINNVLYDPDNNSLLQMQITFEAFVDVIIPRTPRLAEEYGRIQFYGALDSFTDEYMVMTLNHYYIPLAEPTAELFDIAVEQLLFQEQNNRLMTGFSRRGQFAALSPIDRLRVLTILDQYVTDLVNLPMTFQENPGLIRHITSDLTRLAMMGYYSEWSGYGTTRLAAPDQRKLEYFPLSWKQVGYPGPSLGYKALRD